MDSSPHSGIIYSHIPFFYPVEQKRPNLNFVGYQTTCHTKTTINIFFCLDICTLSEYFILANFTTISTFHNIPQHNIILFTPLYLIINHIFAERNLRHKSDV